MVQGELFPEDGSDNNINPAAAFFSRNQLVVGYDKLVLFSIVFLVLFILTYSFGYERGSKAAERKIQSLTAHIETLTPYTSSVESSVPSDSAQTIQVGAVPQATPLERESVDAGITREDVNPSQSEQAVNLKPQGKYTIQLATVLSKTRAQKEVEKLSTKTGALKPFFIKRGKYFEICAGGFDTVASAKPVISDFKSKNISADAFVRPLV